MGRWCKATMRPSPKVALGGLDADDDGGDRGGDEAGERDRQRLGGSGRIVAPETAAPSILANLVESMKRMGDDVQGDDGAGEP